MSNKANEIQFGKFRYSFPQRCLFFQDRLISLTGKEGEILAALLESVSQVVLKETLCERLWPDKQVEASNLFHHVKSLRAKLALKDGRSFIETIPGRGYRFVVPVEREDMDQSNRAAYQPIQQSEAPQPIIPINRPESNVFVRRSWKWLVAISSVAAMVTIAALLSNGGSTKPDTAASVPILTSPEKEPVPRLLKLIAVGPQPYHALLVPKRHELYVSDMGNSVSIIDTERNIVVRRIAVGGLPMGLALSLDGERIFVAQAGGGVGAIDVASHAFRYVSTFRQPVTDIVLTPDGKSAYLSAGFLGVAKLDVANESVAIISATVFVRDLALTPDGRRLYVSYQAKGPGGSFGHDAVGYFDTTTDQFAGAISGFANVGECLTVSPDGTQVWENGADACDSPQYDHIGCPFVPGGLLNIISTSTNKVRAVGVRGARSQCATFFPDGEFAAVGTTDHLMLVRAKDLAVIGSLPIGSTGKIAFSSDGLKAYVPVNAKSQVAVVQIGEQVRSVRLNNAAKRESTVKVAIQSNPDLDAKSIDPSSLRLAGVPAERRNDGVLDASVEWVAGAEGHSLVVKFKLESANKTPKLVLVGKTYAGMPIRGIVD